MSLAVTWDLHSADSAAFVFQSEGSGKNVCKVAKDDDICIEIYQPRGSTVKAIYQL